MNFVFTHIESWIWLAMLFLFLLAYAALTVVIVNKKKKTATAQKLTMLYMVLKVIPILVFIGIFIAYRLIVKIEIKQFAIGAVAIYFIYLLFDTLFLLFTEKQMKKK
jgi:hypothetical protein